MNSRSILRLNSLSRVPSATNPDDSAFPDHERLLVDGFGHSRELADLNGLGWLQSLFPEGSASKRCHQGLISNSSQQLESRRMQKQQIVKIEYQEKIKVEEQAPRTVQFSETAIQRRKEAVKGRAGETQNLATFFRRFTVQFLDLLLNCRDLQGADRQAALQFKKGGMKLQEFSRLFENKVIRKHALAYFKTNLFIKSILKAECEGINSKIIILKYLERFIACILHRIHSWKIPIQ